MPVGDRVYTVMFAGVGGQGVIKAGDILAQAAFLAGIDVKKSEIHGLSRRFGSVSCQVRFGPRVESPLRGHGSVDYLISLEALEGLRHLPYLTPDGLALVCQHWIPVSGQLAAAPPQQAIPDDPRLRWIPLASTATGAGKSGAGLNVFFLGILASLLPLEDEVWEQALQIEVPRHYDKNLAAFRIGQQVRLLT